MNGGNCGMLRGGGSDGGAQARRSWGQHVRREDCRLLGCAFCSLPWPPPSSSRRSAYVTPCIVVSGERRRRSLASKQKLQTTRRRITEDDNAENHLPASHAVVTVSIHFKYLEGALRMWK
jgi:hypothetical protein